MQQLSLQLAPCFSYNPKRLIAHSGIKDALSALEFGKTSSGVFFVFGSSRVGKTHLAISLAEKLGATVRLMNGEQFFTQLETGFALERVETLIVDDADLALNKLVAGHSGAFVQLAESLKNRSARLIFFSNTPIENLPCDDHIKSRLRAAALQIADPLQSELASIVLAMAGQRGIKVSEREAQFLSKRLGRNIVEIEQYLDRLDYLSRLLGRPISHALFADAI